MIKKIVILVVLAISVASIPTFAATGKQDLEAMVTSNLTNGNDSKTALLQLAELSPKEAKSAVSEVPLQATDTNESALSTEWLFMIALFWFVILSNRRSV